jgi:energy-coupling factor transporter transmembrane protein EcfT
MRPDVDRYGEVRSPMHAWDPRVKIVSLLSYIFCVGALTRVGWALVAFGVSLGACALLVRSFERTERVYQAMLSRGFSGKIRTFDPPPMRKGDLWMGALWALIGFALAGLDRFVPLETLWAFIGRGG